MSYLTKEKIIEMIGNAKTRDEVAEFYLDYNIPDDYNEINNAIVSKWSKSALNYIKNKAWDYVEQKERGI